MYIPISFTFESKYFSPELQKELIYIRKFLTMDIFMYEKCIHFSFVNSMGNKFLCNMERGFMEAENYGYITYPEYMEMMKIAREEMHSISPPEERKKKFTFIAWKSYFLGSQYTLSLGIFGKFSLFVNESLVQMIQKIPSYENFSISHGHASFVLFDNDGIERLMEGGQLLLI